MQAYIGRAFEVATLEAIEVYGVPGPVLQTALDANAAAGASVRVLSAPAVGFARAV